jgi:peptidylprolyl isomerase
MIPGFDKAVIGMSVNETKTITIPARDAYGETIVSIPLNQLPAKPDGSAYKAGESIPTQNGAIVIESMTDKEFVIKNNHPLAGRELIFDITIKAVK